MAAFGVVVAVVVVAVGVVAVVDAALGPLALVAKVASSSDRWIAAYLIRYGWG